MDALIAALQKAEPLFVVLLALSAIVRAFDTWVHRSDDVDRKIDGPASVRTDLDALAAELRKDIASMKADIIELHKKASDYGTHQQNTVGLVEKRITAINKRLAVFIENTNGKFRAAFVLIGQRHEDRATSGHSASSLNEDFHDEDMES